MAWLAMGSPSQYQRPSFPNRIRPAWMAVKPARAIRRPAARSVSRMIVTGPSLTSASAMCVWKRPVATGTRLRARRGDEVVVERLRERRRSGAP